MSELEREFGRLEATVEAQDERLERIEIKVDMLVDAMSQARGSWKAIVAAGSLAVTLAGLLGAVISKLLPWVKPH